MRAPVVLLTACLAAAANLGCVVDASAPGSETSDVTSANAAVYVVISEFRAGPPVGQNPGFVEIANTAAAPMDLSGWAVDDVANAGSSPHVLPAGTVLAANARLVVPFAGINTKSADRVRLVDAAGHEVDGQSNFYRGSSTYGLCFARDDASLTWSAAPAPACTPGAANGALGAIVPPVVLNEFAPGTGGFVEIINRDGVPHDVSGYLVDDIGGGSSPKALPAGTVLQPGALVAVAFTGVNSSSVDLVRLLDPAGNELDRRDNAFKGSSNTGKCFARVPDGGPWSTSAVACTRGASNGGPLSPFALQAIGSFSSATGPVTALEMKRDGSYTATVHGTKESGKFTADKAVKTYPLVYSFDGGGKEAAWSASILDYTHGLHVALGDGTEVLAGTPDSEDACDTSGGGWTDDDADPATGLFCICPAPEVLIWSAGGCTP